MRIKRISMLVSVTALALSLAACSPGEELAERLVESQEGVGDIEIDEDGGQIDVEGEDGESFSIGGGDIPEGFPIDAPDGGEVQAVFEQGDEATVSLSYDDGFDTIEAFYQEWAENNGEVTSRSETTDPRSVVWNVEDGDRMYSISVADTGAGIQVMLFAVSGG